MTNLKYFLVISLSINLILVGYLLGKDLMFFRLPFSNAALSWDYRCHELLFKKTLIPLTTGSQTVKKWLVDQGIVEEPPKQGGGCGV